MNQMQPIEDARKGSAHARLLLLCFNYGPHNHTGGFRWRSMVTDLSSRGWRFDILAVDAPAQGLTPPEPMGVTRHPIDATSKIARLRKGLAGMKPSGRLRAARGESIDLDQVPVQRPGGSLSAGGNLRASLNAILDCQESQAWARGALDQGRTLLRTHSYAGIVATSPEPVTFAVGTSLATESGLPLLLDYRDPLYFGRGSELGQLDTVTRRYWKKLEIESLRKARAITDIATGAQEAAIAELAATHPDLAQKPRFFISSGHDPAAIGPVDQTVFRVTYTGWLWPFMPLPSLFKALQQFCEEEPGARKAIEVVLAGVDNHFGGVPIASMARAAGLGDSTRIYRRMPREEARAIMESSAIMTAFDSVTATGLCIPSKLYHYAQCRGDILLIGHETGAMAREAARIGVDTFDPEKQTEIVAALKSAFARWKAGDMTAPNDVDGVLSAERRAAEMHKVLAAMTNGQSALEALRL